MSVRLPLFNDLEMLENNAVIDYQDQTQK